MVDTMAAKPSPCASVPGVFVGPGETALTRTPFGLLLTQVRREPQQLRIALDAARANLRLAAA